MGDQSIVIVGGGLPGLFSALVLSEQVNDKNIVIIEKASHLGGLFQSFEHETLGLVDHGMHILYSTQDEHIDRYLLNVLPEDEWHFLKGNSKDIAGVYHNGYLETKSPYINLQDIDPNLITKAIYDLFNVLHLDAPKLKDTKNAREFFTKRFGETISKELIDPILMKLWGLPSDELSAAVTKLVLMDRIKYFSESEMLNLACSKFIRDRLAFPDQLSLPQSYKSAQYGLYPKKFGIKNVINKIEEILRTRGVKLYLDTEISSFQENAGSVYSAHIINKNRRMTINDISRIFWTTPINALSKLLCVDDVTLSLPKSDPPRLQCTVYFLIKDNERFNGLYYFYCFDHGFKSFRVTNYAAYCDDAVRFIGSASDFAFPICVELHFTDQEYQQVEDIISLAENELIKLGIIKDHSDVLGSFSGKKASGFPILSTKNVANQTVLKNKLMERCPKNVSIVGQEPESGVFFLNDILLKSFPMLKEEF